MARSPRRTETEYRQLPLDFDRGEQLAMIREARLPSRQASDGRSVSAVCLKAVLRVLDDHQRGGVCWLTHQTIAEEACISVRQTRRALEVLESISLICRWRQRTPSGVVCTHFRIVWSELALLGRPQPAENQNPATGHGPPEPRPRSEDASLPNQSPSSGQPPPGPSGHKGDQVATSADQVATSADQVATGADQVATVADRIDKRTDKENRLPPLPPRAPTALPEPWREVAKELQRMGMSRAAPCCSMAAAAGLSPADVRRAIAIYRERGTHLGIGALYDRLVNALPGDDFEHAWPGALRCPRSPAIAEPEPAGPIDPDVAAVVASCGSSREALRRLESLRRLK